MLKIILINTYHKMIEYLLVLDFEANCIRDGVIYPQEIIEFPIIPYNLKTGKIEIKRKFHYYCKTKKNLPNNNFSKIEFVNL